MSSYLVVKNTNSDSCSYLCKDTHTSVPYLKVDTGYLDLTTETTTGTYLVVKNSDSTYRPKKVSIINTTTEGTVTEGYSCSGKYNLYRYWTCTGNSYTITITGFQDQASWSSDYTTKTNSLNPISESYIGNNTTKTIAATDYYSFTLGSTLQSDSGYYYRYWTGTVDSTARHFTNYTTKWGWAAYTASSYYQNYVTAKLTTYTHTAYTMGMTGKLVTNSNSNLITLTSYGDNKLTVDMVNKKYTVKFNRQSYNSDYIPTTLSNPLAYGRFTALATDTALVITMGRTNGQYTDYIYPQQTTFGQFMYYSSWLLNTIFTSENTTRDYYTITSYIPIETTSIINTTITIEN